MATKQQRIDEALAVLTDLEMPRGQRNERSALCLLALIDLGPAKPWAKASAPLIGITPIMDWARKYFDKAWAPNTRETVRRQTMHQFVQAGISIYNSDDPMRPVNSPKAVYQIEPTCLALLQYTEPKNTRFALKVSKRHNPASLRNMRSNVT
jgi:hypothetical protein